MANLSFTPKKKITNTMLDIFKPQKVKYLPKVETNLIFHGVILKSQENVLVWFYAYSMFKSLIDFSNNH